MEIQVIINIMAELFIMIVIGYLLFKVGVFDKNFNQKLTKLILHVTMPALIISSVLSVTSTPAAGTVKTTFIASVIIYLIMPFVGIIVAKLIKVDLKKQGLYGFMMTYSNVGFMGFPVISALYGATGVFYTAIINIIFNVTAFTIGVLILKYGGGSKSGISFGKLFSPGMLFSAAAVLIYMFNVDLPYIVDKTINSIGSTTTPLAMLLMGSTLATIPLTHVFNEGKVYVFCFIKQIIIPIILYPTIRFFIKDTMLFEVIIVLMMMPIATNAIMFAIEHGNDEKLAAKSVFISTVMSIFTVPFILYLFQEVFKFI